MTISSRPPEGEPGECPVCGHQFRLEPATPISDVTCPFCNSLILLFQYDNATTAVHLDRTVIEMICEYLSIPKEEVKDAVSLLEQLEMDSLDLVSLVMEMEDNGFAAGYGAE